MLDVFLHIYYMHNSHHQEFKLWHENACSLKYSSSIIIILQYHAKYNCLSYIYIYILLFFFFFFFLHLFFSVMLIFLGFPQQVLNDEMFTILVVMALFTTFMTTPTVMAIYKPLRGRCSPGNRRLPLTENSQDELRILACVHGPGNVPSLINLVELIRNPKRSTLKLYVMHLVELTDRSSSIMMVQRARKNGFPFIKRFRQGGMQDQIAAAFEAYSRVTPVSVRHLTAISALSTMQEDICHVAQEKRVAMIILPFHKYWTGEREDLTGNLNHDWRVVNQRVLKNASCSVAVLMDRSFCGAEEAVASTTMPKRVCIVLFGGPDDREALELGGRMAEHPAVRLTILRFRGRAGLESMEQSNGCTTVPTNSQREKVTFCSEP